MKKIIFILVLLTCVQMVIGLQFISSNFEVEKTSIRITWTTDEATTGLVEYGVNQNDLSETLEDSAFRSTHDLVITGLNPETTYYIRFGGQSQSAQSLLSSINTVSTVENTPPPKITGVSASDVGENYIDLTWDNSLVNDLKHYQVFRDGVFINTAGTNNFRDTPLATQSTYAYEVLGIDINNNIGEKSNIVELKTLAADITPPIVTDITVAEVGQTSARITWNTDEPSTSTVIYGLSVPTTEIETANLVNSHSVNIPSLNNLERYVYNVKSCDEKVQCTISENRFFVTGLGNEEPLLNVEVPESYNRGFLDLPGISTPFASIEAYVDNVLNKITEADSEGTFLLQNIRLDTTKSQNLLRIVTKTPQGQELSREFVISVDVAGPNVIIEDLPTKSNTGNLNISGTTNELVTLEVFIKPGRSAKPPAITGLSATPTATGVVLNWEDSASNYIIYRADIGAIGYTTLSNFKDEAIEEGNIYTYNVVGVNEFCDLGEVGPAVETITVDGTINVAEELEISTLCNFAPTLTKDVNGAFEEIVALLEGDNDVTVLFTDAGDNKVEFNQNIFSKSTPPQITTNLGENTQSYTPTITIRGTVDEQATVIVYVNGKTDSDSTIPTNVQGIIDRFGRIGGDNDYITQTDQNGNFEVDILLEQIDSFTPTIETTHGYVEGVRANLDLSNQWRNNITIVAVGLAGNTNQVSGQVNYQICGSGGDWGIQLTEFFPKAEKPRYWQQGFASSSFGMDLTYNGPEQRDAEGRPIVVRPSTVRVQTLRPLPASMAAEYDEEYIGNIRTSRTATEKGEYAFTTIKLKKINLPGEFATYYEEEEAIAKHNKEHCVFGAGDDDSDFEVGCIRLPLEIVISYPGKVSEYNGREFVERTRTVTQKTCIFTEQTLDRRLDPDLIPESLLEASLEVLNETSKVLDAIAKPLQTVTEWTAYTCAGLNVGFLFKKIGEGVSCKGKYSDVATKCQIKSNGEADCGGDTDYESCAESILSSANFRQNIKWVCGRVACNAVPSFSKYVKDANENVVEGFQNSWCEGVKDTRLTSGEITDWTKQGEKGDGQTGLEQYENQFASAFINGNGNKPAEINGAEKRLCAQEYYLNNRPMCLGMNPLKASACASGSVEAKGDEGDPDGEYEDLGCSGTSDLFDKLSSRSLCSVNEQSKYLIRTGFSKADGGTKEENYCITKENGPLRAYKSSYVYKVNDETVYQNNELAEENSVADVKDDGTCTITSKNGQEKWISDKEKVVISWDDASRDCNNLIKELGEEAAANNDVCKKSKCWVCQNPGLSKDNGKAYCTIDNKKDGEPIPSAVHGAICDFDGDKNYVADPTSGILRSSQCVCLTATNEYVQLYKRNVDAFKTCFEKILYTGEGNAGTCQAMISRSICDFMFTGLRCKTGLETNSRAARTIDGTSRALGALTGGMSGAAAAIREDYGGTNMYQAVFQQEKILRSACVGAITGDWDAALLGSISQAIQSQAVNSTVSIRPTQREFRGYNPINGFVDHLYHVGLYFNAGADITNLQVSLVCSRDNTCPDFGGPCDCARASTTTVSDLPITNRFTSGQIKKGEVIDKAETIQVSSQDSFVSGVRYDKVRVSWSYRDGDGEIKTSEKLEPISVLGAQYPPECKFDPVRGKFACAFISDPRGSASFIGDPIIKVGTDLTRDLTKNLDSNTFDVDVGEDISISGNVNYIRPSSGSGAITVQITESGNRKIFNGQDKVTTNLRYQQGVSTFETRFKIDSAGSYVCKLNSPNPLGITFTTDKDVANRNQCFVIEKTGEDQLSWKEGSNVNAGSCNEASGGGDCKKNDEDDSFTCGNTNNDIKILYRNMGDIGKQTIVNCNTPLGLSDTSLLTLKLLYTEGTSQYHSFDDNVVYDNDGPVQRQFYLKLK